MDLFLRNKGETNRGKEGGGKWFEQGERRKTEDGRWKMEDGRPKTEERRIRRTFPEGNSHAGRVERRKPVSGLGEHGLNIKHLFY
ncbi:MAG: hypothetical protein WCE68_04490 [Anaerolineales bacterium]